MSGNLDMSNPMIATPVAVISSQLFAAVFPAKLEHLTDLLSHGKSSEERAEAVMASLIKLTISCAEALAAGLMDSGHLPRTTETEEIKGTDDATLLIQSMILLGLRWEPYGPADPRGELCFDGIRYSTKAVKGVPSIPGALREKIEMLVAPLLRRL